LIYLKCRSFLSFPWYASHDRRGFGNLMFPLWFIGLFRWFICLLGCGSFHFVPLFFSLCWVLWLIYMVGKVSSMLIILACNWNLHPPIHTTTTDGWCVWKGNGYKYFSLCSRPKANHGCWIYLPTIHMHRTHNNHVVRVIFWGWFCEKCFEKKTFYHCHHCLQYERVLKNF
jgi:hypothetical protein